MISKKLLDILVCPRCKGELLLEEDKLICRTGNIAFPIKNDIPIVVFSILEKGGLGRVLSGKGDFTLINKG